MRMLCLLHYLYAFCNHVLLSSPLTNGHILNLKDLDDTVIVRQIS